MSYSVEPDLGAPFTVADVVRLAKALGYEPITEDLVEITVRLNVIIEGLQDLREQERPWCEPLHPYTGWWVDAD
ncbi:MAG: hypothetical protein KF813_03510 [Trueperaceae bacterium]|nr:hypothetical protein [Trueperaceae bacterium]